MDCPVCKKPLIVVERNNVELDYCIACKGFWFDEGELQLLIKQFNLNFDVSLMAKPQKGVAAEKPYKCPRCDKDMEKVFMGYTLLDRCVDGHGIWFNAGELGFLTGMLIQWN